MDKSQLVSLRSGVRRMETTQTGQETNWERFYSTVITGSMEDLDFFQDENVSDLSYSELDNFPDFIVERAEEIYCLHLDHNQILALPRVIGAFVNLVSLELSNNGMTYLSPEIMRLSQLRTLTARNNFLDKESLPKELSELQGLQALNLSGNQFSEFPPQLTKLTNLKCLYMGANRLTCVSKEIKNLERWVLFKSGLPVNVLRFLIGR